MKKIKIIHPWLLAIFPLLFLYYHNMGQITLRQLAIPILVVLLVVSILFILSKLFSGSWYKAGLIVSWLVVLFFSYGYFYQADSRWAVSLGNFVIGINKITFLIWIASFFLLTFLILKSKFTFDKLNKIINFSALILILLSFYNIFYYQFFQKGKIDYLENTNSVVQMEASDRPDIYYIILDEYAGLDSMKEIFDYENEDLVSFLDEKGFYIAKNSTSNYMQTYLSLTSSLNMEYLNDFSDTVGAESRDWSALYQKMEKSNLWRQLKNQGYSFYNFRSGYGPTNFLGKYDLNFQAKRFGLDEFSMTLLQTTALRPFLESTYENDKRERVSYIFDKLPNIESDDFPVFVLAHVVSPHSPYVFKSDGTPQNDDCDQLNEDNSWSDYRKECYLEEVKYLNSMIKESVEGILETSSNSIIIVQSDHGTKSNGFSGDPSEAFQEERSQIFNAYYFPNNNYDGLYQEISPVNSFRVVLNNYFNAGYELLPDKIYFSSQDQPFNFSEFIEVE